MAKHIHAETIKAWADGAEIQFRHTDGEKWMAATQPVWSLNKQYRVKPNYPTTRMTYNQLHDACLSAGNGPNWDSLQAASVANAAIKHAIDSGQVVWSTDN